MNRRTQAIIGITVLALGIGVYSLGLIEQESNVRYVYDLHDEPAGHAAGEFVLLGIPQPADHPDTGAPNPEFAAATTHVSGWVDERGTRLVAQHTLAADASVTGITWTLSNTTHTTSGEILATTNETWTTPGEWTLFQVDDFETGQKVWAIYDGVLREGVRPQPSQLTGHLLDDLPPGALVYRVQPDGYTVGCSSKFLPDDVAEEYDPDGDGVADGF